MTMIFIIIMHEGRLRIFFFIEFIVWLGVWYCPHEAMNCESNGKLCKKKTDTKIYDRPWLGVYIS